MEKIGIFGASSTGKDAYELIKNKYEVLFFVDNNKEKWGQTFSGKIVIGISEIQKYHVNTILVASVYYEEIIKQLYEMDFTNILIFLRWKGENGYKTFLNRFSPENYKQIQFEDRTKIYEKKLRNIKEDQSLRVNSKTRKKVLIVAYFFPPIGGGGVQRVTKFIKYLREFGYEPIVVTVDQDHYYWSKNDYSILKDVPQNVQIIRIVNRIYKWTQLDLEDIQNLYDMYSGILGDAFPLMDYWKEIVDKEPKQSIIPDNYVIWCNDVLEQISYQVDLTDIDLVFTTGSPFSSFFIGYYLKKVYGIPWVMDFRDLWTKNYLRPKIIKKEVQIIEETLEKKLLKEADKVIGVGEYAVNKLKKCGEFNKQLENHEKYLVITNGYDSEDFEKIVPLKEKRFTICFGGTIYYDEKVMEAFRIVIDKINHLVEVGLIEKEKIVFKIMGNRNIQFENYLQYFDKYELIEWIPYLDHKVYITHAYEAQILFITLPWELIKVAAGKIYEYLRMKGAILGILSVQTSAKELIEDLQRGKSFELEETEGIERYIQELYLKWKNGETLGYGGNKKMEQYERRNLSKKLAEEFDKLKER